MLRLEMSYGGKVRHFHVRDGEVRLGSAPDNDLVLALPGISRHHALLRQGGRGLELLDLGSKNGLVSEGQRRERVLLAPGGEAVQIGKAFLRIEEISTSDAELELALAPDSRTAGARAGSSARSPSTAEVPTPGRTSSAEAALQLVRRIERSGAGAAGRRGRLLADACRTLGAASLFAFRLDGEGEMILVEAAGQPGDEELRAIERLARGPSPGAARGPSRAAAGVERHGSSLLSDGGRRGPAFLAACFATPAAAGAPWRARRGPGRRCSLPRSAASHPTRCQGHLESGTCSHALCRSVGSRQSVDAKGVDPLAEGHEGQGVAALEVAAVDVHRLAATRRRIRARRDTAEIDLLPQSGNLDLPGISDQATGVTSNNYFNYQFSHRDRDELQAAITDFVDHVAGSHEVKLGTSYSNLRSQLQNNLSGGAEYLDYNGPINRNARLELQQQLGLASFTGKLYSGFLQDAWRPLERLTLQLGARFDEIKFRNEAGVQISDQHYLQPRLGFAYDLTGDAKTVLRGSYGILMSPNELTLPSFTRVDTAPLFLYAPCSAFYPTAAACAAAVAHSGPTGYLPNDPLRRDPLGYFERAELGSGPEIIEPGLKPMTNTQYTLGIERQLWNRTTLELAYIHKKTNDIFEDTCAENVPTPTPDPTFTHCPIFEVATLPAARRNYQGALLTLNSRASDWLNLKASYVYSRSRGSIEDTQNAGTDFDFYPNLFVNRYGYLSDDRRHRVRLDGYARLPHGFSIAIQSDYSSPFPYSKVAPTAPYDVIYLASRGSFRGTSTYNINLEVRKGFPIGPVRTELIATVLNLLGSEQINSVCETALGCNGIYSWGDPYGFSQPRRYEAGVRLEF